MKWGHYFSVVFGMLALTSFASALPALALVMEGQIVITEIMYDPPAGDSGHEWIEVYNAGAVALKLSDLRLSEGGTNHKINVASGVDMLASGAYAVIAANAATFSADYPDFHGPLFHAALSLGNSGDTITLRDSKLVDINSATYAADPLSSGVGNSLQRSASGTGGFAPHMPTPGTVISSSIIAPKVKEVPPPKPARTKAVKKTSASKNISSNNPYASDTSTEPSTNTDAPAVYPQAAAAGETAGTTSLWWIGTIVLAGVAGIATFASRRVAKREWDISEEKEGE